MGSGMEMQSMMMNEMVRQQNEMQGLQRMLERENQQMLRRQREEQLRQLREEEERILREIYEEDY